MSLSDFGSIASIISLFIGLIGGGFVCYKVKCNKSSKENSIKSFFQFGNNSQEIK